MDDLEQRIAAYIEEEMGVDDEGGADGGWRCGPDTPLLGRPLDSLGLMKLMGFLETEFALEIDDADMDPENFTTITHIAALVRAKLGTGTPQPTSS